MPSAGSRPDLRASGGSGGNGDAVRCPSRGHVGVSEQGGGVDGERGMLGEFGARA